MIFITGAAKRLGATLATHLASQGYDLLLHTCRSKEQLQEVASICQSHDVQVQLCYGDLIEIEEFIEQHRPLFEKVTGLINNVGSYFYNPVIAMHSALKQLLPLNLLAPVALIEACLPAICRKQGRIINMGVARLHAPWTKAAAYGLTKQALWHYTQALAIELAKHNVTVNMISPGHLSSSVDLPANLPMHRPATEQEVAALVAYLLSDSGSYITGQNIEIAGGL